ncbi:type II secretion system protein [Paraclostridium sordellii]|uniref:type II secretion system protein n=1 Tax=Paraclostridium sordellii TaxID=1505 RepID=UPI0005DCA1E4|nr:type II secretion system protein [Paeniclostridium sordellii]CEN26037.1 type IV pilin [[Clostridium] sordellii] [Paeniclostridium sordellii]CEP91949.1 type IV pilin [[Clostridium] sordellii] [Paeniclostridium sordellii]CEQ25697.1 type IV pilin [[Clostridium] sordellii] [Paeniclostridium sordellii]
MEKGSRGFTLIEVIIALAIISIVSFIGYQVISKTNALSKDQLLTSDMQNGVNNLKRYMTKELSSAKEVDLFYSNKNVGSIKDIKSRKDDYDYIKKSINEITSNKKITYSYIIKFDNLDFVNYSISIYKKNNKLLYSLDRIDKKVKLNFLHNQILDKDLIPLKIEIKDKSIYDVELNYIKRGTRIYSFDVYNRISNSQNEDENNGLKDNEEVFEENYLLYCANQISKYFKNAKNELSTELKLKLEKDIKGDIDELFQITKKNPPKDMKKVRSILDSIENNIKLFKRHSNNQLDLAFNDLNRLENYVYVAHITTEYIGKEKYDLNNNNILNIHDYTQYKIVGEISKARDDVFMLVNEGYKLYDVWNVLHTQILSGEILSIQNNINWNIVDRFNEGKDISNDSKKVSMDINNLIDKIIDQQVKIKETLKNKRYKNIYEEDAITHLDKANRFLIEVKYMLSQTNYHKK